MKQKLRYSIPTGLLWMAILTTVLTTWAMQTAPIAHAAEKSADKSSKEKWLLRYKFQLGEVLRYHVHHTANVRTTIEETTQQVKSNSESIKAWKVTDVLPSGDMEFIHLVEHVRMSNLLPDRPLAEYDSALDSPPPPIFRQAASAVGVPISLLRIAPDGKIVQREEKLPQPSQSSDMRITLRLPEGPIRVGDRWHESYDIHVEQKSGARLKIRTRRLCKLLAVAYPSATLSTQYQILTPVNSFIESQLADRMTKGTIKFDLAKGRITSQQMDVNQRILGFAGETSSMHFVSRLEEQLIGPDEKLARRTDTAAEETGGNK